MQVDYNSRTTHFEPNWTMTGWEKNLARSGGSQFELCNWEGRVNRQGSICLVRVVQIGGGGRMVREHFLGNLRSSIPTEHCFKPNKVPEYSLTVKSMTYLPCFVPKSHQAPIICNRFPGHDSEFTVLMWTSTGTRSHSNIASLRSG